MERLTKEMSKSELEKEISKWGDYVKMDNLERFLKVNFDLPLDIKKFVYQKLAIIYEGRKMFADAAKCYEKIAELEQLPSEQLKKYLKAVEMYIKVEMFDKANNLIQSKMENLNSIQKKEISNSIVNFYKNEAKECLAGRRSKTVKIYEKMLVMNIVPINEKEIIKEDLLKLYMNIGNMIEYGHLKNKNFKKEEPKKEVKEEVEGLDFLYK